MKHFFCLDIKLMRIKNKMANVKDSTIKNLEVELNRLKNKIKSNSFQKEHGDEETRTNLAYAEFGKMMRQIFLVDYNLNHSKKVSKSNSLKKANIHLKNLLDYIGDNDKIDETLCARIRRERNSRLESIRDLSKITYHDHSIQIELSDVAKIIELIPPKVKLVPIKQYKKKNKTPQRERFDSFSSNESERLKTPEENESERSKSSTSNGSYESIALRRSSNESKKSDTSKASRRSYLDEHSNLVDHFRHNNAHLNNMKTNIKNVLRKKTSSRSSRLSSSKFQSDSE